MRKCSCGNAIEDRYIICMDCHNKRQLEEQRYNWIKAFETAWRARDVESIVGLFDDEASIFDTPFGKALTAREAWQEIVSDDFVKINSVPLTLIGEECFVEFQLDYPDKKCNAINHIKFNTVGKCVYLKQWFMEAEK